MKHLITAALALLLSGAAASKANAQSAAQGGVTERTLMGRWCTGAGSMDFQPGMATVTFANGAQKIMGIKRIEVHGSQITVVWVEDAADQTPQNRGQGSHTTYGNFTANRMTQFSMKTESGGTTPERQFQRCN